MTDLSALQGSRKSYDSTTKCSRHPQKWAMATSLTANRFLASVAHVGISQWTRNNPQLTGSCSSPCRLAQHGSEGKFQNGKGLPKNWKSQFFGVRFRTPRFIKYTRAVNVQSCFDAFALLGVTMVRLSGRDAAILLSLDQPILVNWQSAKCRCYPNK